MPSNDALERIPPDRAAVIARYKTIGLFGGLFLGAVVGVMIAGPNFGEWLLLRSLVTIVGSMGVFGVAGYIAGELAVGGQVAGPGSAIHSDTEHSSSTAGLDASGGGSGGGDSGGDGGGDS